MTQRPDAPAPLRRRGPRPLLLHLMLASWPGFATGSPNSSSASPSWNADADPPDAAGAELIAGIAAYRRHPWVRDLPDPPAIWEEGGSRLLDYRHDRPEAPAPVLFVPSLVNRAHVLDLMPGRSLLRFLAGEGMRPLLLDWGWPGAVERRFTLTDYIAGRLERALIAVGRPVVLAGYCMGGLLAVAAALRRPDLVRALALLATPWDFHAPGRGGGAPGRRHPCPVRAGARRHRHAAGGCAADAVRHARPRRHRRANTAISPAPAQDGPEAELFVALEDWLNDGIPLAAPVAREMLSGWYGENTPARGDLAGRRAAGRSGGARPAGVRRGARPRPHRAAGKRPAARREHPRRGAARAAAGHIGMAAGPRAEAALWRPLLDWLRGLRMRSARWTRAAPPDALCEWDRHPGSIIHGRHRHRLGRPHAGGQLQRRARHPARARARNGGGEGRDGARRSSSPATWTR